MSDNISVVTSNYVPGYKISEIKGLIWGLTIRSRGLGGNIVAGLRAIGGGEIKEYVTLLNKARDAADIPQCKSIMTFFIEYPGT